MNKYREITSLNLLVLLGLVLLVVILPVYNAAGEDTDRDSQDQMEPYKDEKALPKVDNPAYKKNCGSCHFAYQPGLLPARSWQKIINEPGSHPGRDVPVDQANRTDILQYLTKNSAEANPSARSRKILKSIGDSTPLRISEIPYIKKRHKEMGDAVFARKSVGSRSNCTACHMGAEDGIYAVNIVVPR